jgi:alcohol dehydrogenase class IV
MKDFVVHALPTRVVFGAGTVARLAEELDALGVQRALVLATPQQQALAERIAAGLGNRCVGVHARAAMHVPIENAREARDDAQRRGADGIVAAGGGSTTGLAKAIALESALPILAVPTTYAGSEMTPIYGLTEGGVKRTGRDPRVLPRTVIYDPELTLDLRLGMTVTSGLNAIAHAAEGLYARDRNPLMELAAEEGIRAVASALPALLEAPRSVPARADALYGAWLCGMVLGNVGMALHHKLCHTLGGGFDLPHADVHSVVLPQALQFNAQAAPEAMQRIARALGTDTAAGGVFDLARRLGAPLALKDIGMRREDLARATALAVESPYWNPRPVDASARNDIATLLERAFDGTRPP